MSISGDRIRELRLRNHFTLDDVARRLGVGRQAIYKYEQGTVTNIPLENLEAMAEMFGTTPGYLAGWTDDVPDLPPASRQSIATSEALIISGGVDRMPKDRREQALAIMKAAFSDYFKED